MYRRALKRFKEFLSLREAAGGVGYLTKTDIVQYKSHLLAEGLSPRTGNLYLTSVRQFFKYLESNRIYPDVSAGLKGFKRSYGFNRDPLTSAAGARSVEFHRYERHHRHCATSP